MHSSGNKKASHEILGTHLINKHSQEKEKSFLSNILCENIMQAERHLLKKSSETYFFKFRLAENSYRSYFFIKQGLISLDPLED